MTPETALELLHDGRRHVLRRPAAVAGRGDHCEFQVVHPLVSREHARFELRPEGLFVFDLGSHNGTWVNGTRIDGVRRVRAGDRVRLGAEGAEFVVVRASLLGVDLADRGRETEASTADLGDSKAAGVAARVTVNADPAADPAGHRARPRAEPSEPPPPVRTDCRGGLGGEPRHPDPAPLPPVEPPARPGFRTGRFVAGVIVGLAAVAALATYTDFPERLSRIASPEARR
ncbi:MAG: hypothetical protein HMLKMBBP_03079 [Planctomycetes bacterium]|nr:hypothetical protein [Planctomycetota bacterium]